MSFVRTVELFHVDTGTTEYADISSICAETPPMLCAIPQQALQCVLDGVKQVGGVKQGVGGLGPLIADDVKYSFAGLTLLVLILRILKLIDKT